MTPANADEATGAETLALRFVAQFPQAAVRILEAHAVDDTASLLRELPARELAAVVRRMTPAYALQYLDALSLARIADLLRQLSRVDAAALLRAMPARRRAAVLNRMPNRFSVPLGWMLRHAAGTVGAWTDASAATLTTDITAEEALDRLRREPAGDDTLYVLDRDHHLRGVVTVAGLLSAAPAATLGELVGESPAPLQSQASLDAVATFPAWRRHDALPVADWRQRYVGVLHRRDMDRALQRGAGPAARPPLSDTLLEASEVYWLGLGSLLHACLELFTSLPPQRTRSEQR